MEFLYGDSTSSPLATDFVDLLRKTIDCCVAVLESEHRTASGETRRRQQEARTEKEAARLRELEATVTRAVSLAIEGASPDTPVARCADAILRATGGAVSSTEGDLQSALAAESKKIEGETAKEKIICLKAFERLVLAHDLPGSDRELRIEQRKDGAYSARLHATTPYGLTVALDLEIPAGHRFSRLVRVGDLAEALEIQVPKSGGWLRKESRLQGERLGRLVVMSCRTGARGQHVAVRAEGIEEGYEFSWAPRQARVHATRVAPDLSGPVDFDLSEADSRAVATFIEKLAGTALELSPNRKALASAQLDGEALEGRPPSLLVQRLVEVMAPTTREIAARSGSADELIIRRLLGDGRREERFVRRAELLEKLAPLPEAGRAMFAPLGLGTIPGNPPGPEDVMEEISGGYIVEERVVERRNGDSAVTPPLRPVG
jgi:hypothetical protein